MRKRSIAPIVPLAYAAAPAPTQFVPRLPDAERLVGLGFRYWMLGRMTGDVACWEKAWNLYSERLDVAGAKVAVTHLSAWVSALSRASRRDIEVLPEPCRNLCQDECIAVSMIAACQHDTCPAMRACAFALAECSLIDGVLEEAQGFADAMTELELVLSCTSIVTDVSSVGAAGRLLQ